MSDDVKLEPPHLGLAGVATDVDQRIANLISVYEADVRATREANPDDVSLPMLESALWGFRLAQVARAALHGIEKTSHPVVILQLCREGLVVPPE